MIESTQNHLVKHLSKLRVSRAYRHSQKRCIISSLKTIKELPNNTTIKTLLIEQDLSLHSEKTFFTNRSVVKKITGFPSPEGVVAEVELPDYQDVSKLSSIVILDNIQDPGNLGTILRTALALGYKGAYLTSGCVDPFNDKVISASKGAVFHMPINMGPIEDLHFEGTIWSAHLQGEPLTKAKFEGPFAIAFGNEGSGISEYLENQSKVVAIAMPGGVESLNVASAASIILHHALNYSNGNYS